MSTHPYPVEFVDRFLKEAAAMRPYGAGDAKRVANRKVPRGPQVYAQPVPPVPTTQPELVANQKAVPPPPVT